MKGRDYLRCSGIEGRIRWILKKKGLRNVGSGQGPVAVYCEYGHGFQVS
jgi:hypothetical protein